MCVLDDCEVFEGEVVPVSLEKEGVHDGVEGREESRGVENSRCDPLSVDVLVKSVQSCWVLFTHWGYIEVWGVYCDICFTFTSQNFTLCYS